MAATLQTVINRDVDRVVTGYMLNTLPNEEARKKVADLQAKISERFGDLVWNTPPDTLHITLMDWVAPLVEYGKNKETLFEEIFPSYDAVLTKILKAYAPITVEFTEIKATPGAIIAIGRDNGEFNDIRNRFLREVSLPPDTKQPPTIIHSTIARYRKEADVQPVIDFLSHHSLSFTHKVDHFRLVREDIAPQLKYQLVKEYSLS